MNIKNKHFLFLFFLNFCCLFLNAQVVTISDDISIRNDISFGIIGKYDEKILLFRDKSTEFEVQSYDENMHLSTRKEIDLDKRRTEVLEAMGAKNYFSIIYKAKVKNRDVVKIHRYSPKMEFIDSITIKDYGVHFYTPTPKFIFSEDKNIVLFYTIEEESILKTWAFNIDKMERLWDKSILLKDSEERNQLEHILVDNTGHGYFIFEKDISSSPFKKENQYFEVCEFSDDNFRRYNIDFEKHIRSEVAFSFDNVNQSIMAAGLYTDKNPNKATGYYYLAVPTKEVEHPKLIFQPFDDAFISSVTGKEGASNKGLTDFAVRQIVLRRDGGLLMINEKTRKYDRLMTSSRPTASNARMSIDYYYEDLLLISINPDGTRHWKNLLHKKQFSQNDEAIFSSYCLVKTPSSLRVLFNDEVKTETTTSEYIIKSNGEADHNNLFSTENQDILLRFKDALQVGANEIIIPSEYRTKLKLVKLKY
jgi:hypothetical protein